MLNLSKSATLTAITFLMGTQLTPIPKVKALPTTVNPDEMIVICENPERMENCWGFFPVLLTDPETTSQPQFSFSPIQLETFSGENYNDDRLDLEVWQIPEVVVPTEEEAAPSQSPPEGYVW